jgi:uncharacterized membrane protein (UPF0127 family)
MFRTTGRTTTACCSGFWRGHAQLLIKNTHPLDISPIPGCNWSVADNAQPCRSQRRPPHPSAAPARYVLELRAGKAVELGVRPGTC